LHSGNKAFIFSIDVMIAVSVVAIIMIISAFYLVKAGDESISKLQTIRIGSDILALMDNDGTLDTLSVEETGTELNSLLPINYHMRIRIRCNGQESVTVETTGAIPNDRFIGSGKRVFVSETGNYCLADFNIWLK